MAKSKPVSKAKSKTKAKPVVATRAKAKAKSQSRSKPVAKKTVKAKAAPKKTSVKKPAAKKTTKTSTASKTASSVKQKKQSKLSTSVKKTQSKSSPASKPKQLSKPKAKPKTLQSKKVSTPKISKAATPKLTKKTVQPVSKTGAKEKPVKKTSPKQVSAEKKQIETAKPQTKTVAVVSVLQAKLSKSATTKNIPSAKEKVTMSSDVKEKKPVTKVSKNILDTLAGIQPYQAHAHESYMNDEQRKHFKNLLLNMRQQLMEDVDRTVSDMREDEDKNLPDITDRATKEEEINLMLRTRNREGKLLKKIEDALDRLEHNEFGYCDSCGIEIGFKRLEARPTATLCIDCKTLEEIREKQRSQ